MPGKSTQAVQALTQTVKWGRQGRSDFLGPGTAACPYSHCSDSFHHGRALS